MFGLLKEEDKNVLGGTNFYKNAIFYKDLLCFCDAYQKIIENRDNLPNFCYLHDGKLCLEGICLFIKMYATEFKFETLKLTLDYLKILYYAAASYADEEGVVDQEIIIEEFNTYRDVSIDMCNKSREELVQKEKERNTENGKIDVFSQKNKGQKVLSTIFSVLSPIFLAFSIVSFILSMIILIWVSAQNAFFLISLITAVLCAGVSVLFKIIGKVLLRKSDDLAYQAQVERRNKDEQSGDIKQLQDKYNKLICEKYEYKMCFFEILSKYSKVLDFKKILDKARQYKILSYNMIYDIKRIFKSQQKDIDEINSDIERIPFTADCFEKFSSIYGKIIEQDWLFYNAEVRVHFLKKFGDFCERLHVWKLNFNGEKINPFDVRVKELAREKVAYLKSSDKKFISATLSDIMQTKYIKNIEDFNFNGNYSVDSFRRVKSSFLKSFYNYDILDGEENVFYGGKNNNKKIDSELLFESEKIPTFINLKLKLVENIVGLGNSDASVIKSMAQSLFGNEQNESQEQILNITEADIDFPAFKAEISQEFEDRIVYLISGREVVGYKMN